MNDGQHIRWRDLDRAQRKRIITAVSHGRAVEDPRDAPLAIAFATSYGSRFAKQSQWRPVVRLSIIVAADVGLVASGGFDLQALAPVLLLLVVFAWGVISAPIYRRRSSSAERRNRALADQVGLPSVTLEIPESGQKTSRFLRLGDVLVLGWVVVAIVLARAPGISGARTHKVDTPSLDAICARERRALHRLESKLSLSPPEVAHARYEIELQALINIQRLTPAAERSRQEDLLLLLKTEGLTAQQVDAAALQRGDQAGAAAASVQVRDAGDRFGAYASGLGARTCARP